MPSLKLTKSAVDSARPGTTDYELWYTIVPGFFCKITPAGRKVFMLSYRTPTCERREPSLRTYGQITVDQARKLAQDFLAGVRGGADPSQERQAVHTAPTVKDLADRFMIEHSEARHKPSTVRGNRTTLKVHVLPAMGKIKVADVKRSDVADLVEPSGSSPRSIWSRTDKDSDGQLSSLPGTSRREPLRPSEASRTNDRERVSAACLTAAIATLAGRRLRSCAVRGTSTTPA